MMERFSVRIGPHPLSIALIAGGVAAGGPVGAAVGAGLTGAAILGKKFARQGARAATKFVDNFEDPFGDRLDQIAQRAQSDPQGALQELQQAWAEFEGQAKSAIAQGGNKAKVAQQALNNTKLMTTVDTLFSQLGGSRPQSGAAGATQGQGYMPGQQPNTLSQSKVGTFGQLGVPVPGMPRIGGSNLPGGGPGAPNANPAAGNGFDWKGLANIVAPAAANITGRVLESRANNRQADDMRERMRMLDELARGETQRRDFYSNAVLPNLLKGSGYNDQQIAARMKQSPTMR